ncbi:hypothetical protein D9V29_11485 [Mycetocola manganoxydans]|uniref:Uncharacterized protein n=1 Tax=Mycetocola manganoxydans TaxID=699879 RepID=A0A3L6ZPF5_9MICO|nr:hypothetical protein D9V29_11485 [Mycetocola manganoxydans]
MTHRSIHRKTLKTGPIHHTLSFKAHASDELWRFGTSIGPKGSLAQPIGPKRSLAASTNDPEGPFAPTSHPLG